MSDPIQSRARPEMKRTRIPARTQTFLLAAAIVLFFCSAGTLLAQPTGLVAKLEGEVQFKTSAESERLRPLRKRMEILDGFVIVVPTDGEARILGVDGKLHAYTEAGEHVFQTGEAVIRLDEVRELNAQLYRRGVESRVGEVDRSSGGAEGPIPYVAPEKAVRSGRIQISWRARSGIAVRSLELHEGGRVLWRQDLSEEDAASQSVQAEVPELQPATEDRRLTLVLRYRTSDGAGSEEHPFVLLGRKRLADLEAALKRTANRSESAGSRYYVRSLIYNRYGLTAEAEEAYRKARRLNPDLF